MDSRSRARALAARWCQRERAHAIRPARAEARLRDANAQLTGRKARKPGRKAVGGQARAGRGRPIDRRAAHDHTYATHHTVEGATCATDSAIFGAAGIVVQWCRTQEWRTVAMCSTFAFSLLAGASGMATPTRRPWEFGRFLSTAAAFNAPSDVLARVFGAGGSPTPRAPGEVLWSPQTPNGLEFAVLDDVVMGGASKSELSVRSDGLRWSGEVTTANNGGFTGCRTKALNPPLDLSGCKGIVLRVRADGFRYKCILRDSADWNGVAWTASFDTPKGAASIKLPFSKFVPTQYARTLPRSPPLKTDSIAALQLSLSKFEYDGGLNPTFREGSFDFTLVDVQTF